MGHVGSDEFLLLPDRSNMQDYLRCFFEHANVTYRYVPRLKTENLLDKLSEQDEGVLRDDAAIAMLFTIAGVGCAWDSSWRNSSLEKARVKAIRLYRAGKSRLDKLDSKFPPSLNELCARVALSQLLLATGYFNTAWVTHGATVRLAEMVDLHKAQKQGSDEDHHARSTFFWSLFMLDRYLSIVSGRPMAANEHDITIGLRRAMSSSCTPAWGQPESKLVAGACSHAALTRIIGRITTRLYSAGGCPSEYRESIVLEIEEGLRKWLEQTPKFFHPRDDAHIDAEAEFYDVSWTLGRQQNTVEGAFLFTRMLLYRGYVLDALKEPHQALSPLAQTFIGKCLDAAMRLARYAGEVAKEFTFNAAFWMTSHLTSRAIAVLVAYLTVLPNAEHKKEIETVLHNALEGHKKLDQSAGSQAHRFLEESRTIAQQHQQAVDSPLTFTAINGNLRKNGGVESNRLRQRLITEPSIGKDR